MTTPTHPRSLAGIRWGLHVVTVVLVVVTVARSVATGVPALPAVVAGLAFLALYAAAGLPVLRRAPWVYLWIVALTALWVVTLHLSPEFVWLLFPLVLVAGHLLPWGWGLAYACVATVAGVTAPLWHGQIPAAAQIIGPAIGALFAVSIARGYTVLLRDAIARRDLIEALVRTQDEMAEVQDELARSQRESGAEGERTRLSRDLHDTIAQDLSSIALLARGAASTGQDAYAQIEDLARGALEDTRRIVHALAPAQLDDDAVVDAVRRLGDRLAAETGASVTVEADPRLPTLGPAVDVALLRTVQSGFANVRRHARAAHVRVTLTDMGDSVRWDIADDGVGFDVGAWERGAGAPDSYGLAAMRDRLRELGGGLDVESEPGGGTVLSAWVPVGGAR